MSKKSKTDSLVLKPEAHPMGRTDQNSRWVNNSPALQFAKLRQQGKLKLDADEILAASDFLGYVWYRQSDKDSLVTPSFFLKFMEARHQISPKSMKRVLKNMVEVNLLTINKYGEISPVSEALYCSTRVITPNNPTELIILRSKESSGSNNPQESFGDENLTEGSAGRLADGEISFPYEEEVVRPAPEGAAGPEQINEFVSETNSPAYQEEDTSAMQQALSAPSQADFASFNDYLNSFLPKDYVASPFKEVPPELEALSADDEAEDEFIVRNLKANLINVLAKLFPKELVSLSYFDLTTEGKDEFYLAANVFLNDIDAFTVTCYFHSAKPSQIEVHSDHLSDVGNVVRMVENVYLRQYSDLVAIRSRTTKQPA